MGLQILALDSLLLLGGSVVRNLPAMQEIQERQFRSLGWEDSLEEGMATHSSILPGESHGQRGLAGGDLLHGTGALRTPRPTLPSLLFPRDQ